MGLLFGCAFPSKFMLAALCFYLVPVELERQGYGSADIGRLQMIYPLMMVLCVPLFASLADRLRQRTLFVVMGGVLAGAGALLAGIGASPAVMAMILLLLGLGQAMSITSQSALVADSARQAPGVSGALVASSASGTSGTSGTSSTPGTSDTPAASSASGAVLGVFRLVERGGAAAGNAAGGILLGAVGFSAATLSIGVLVAAGALGFALSVRPGRRPSGTPPGAPQGTTPDLPLGASLGSPRSTTPGTSPGSPLSTSRASPHSTSPGLSHGSSQIAPPTTTPP